MSIAISLCLRLLETLESFASARARESIAITIYKLNTEYGAACAQRIVGLALAGLRDCAIVAKKADQIVSN